MAASLCIRAMKHKHWFGMSRVWLTTKHQRDKAKDYTYVQLRHIAQVLREENPEFYREIGKEFQKPTTPR